MEKEFMEFIGEMEGIRYNISGVGDILKVMLDGAREDDTTLERVVNAGFAVDNYLDILVDRMDKAIADVSAALYGRSAAREAVSV